MLYDLHAYRFSIENLFMKMRLVTGIGILREAEAGAAMKITSKITVGFATAAAALGITIYMLPSFTELDPSGISTLVTFMLVAMTALYLFIRRTVTRPLREATQAARSLLKGVLSRKVYHGKITSNTVKNANEVKRIILALEVMRRKMIELRGELEDSVEKGAMDVQRIRDELADREDVLKKANAQLATQSQEFQNINEKLTSKNQELSEMNEQLRRLDAMKDDFLIVAAEELCTPIQPILDSVESAEKGRISDEDAWKIIATQSKRLAGAANALLDVGRIESGTFTYDMQPLSIKQLIDAVTLALTELAGEDGTIKFNVKMDPGGDVMIVGDWERLLRAFANIINNAVRFSTNGTITIQSTVSHETGLVEIRIIDDGPGFSESILPVLFDKYVTSTQEKERGTGLGLFITREILEAHNGSIAVQNNPDGKGVTFALSLPMQRQRIEPRIPEKELESSAT